MRTVSNSFPPKTVAEIVNVKFNLAPAIASDTVSAVTFRSLPEGLTFTSPAIVDTGKAVEVKVGGGYARQVYTITAECTLASGLKAEPYARLPIEEF